jgi:putative ABC transport system substrate-binding protein
MRLARLTTTVLALALLAAPLAADAQSGEEMPRIAVVFGAVPIIQLLGSESSDLTMRALLQGLRTLGYVEGQNIVIERRSAEGRFERLPEIFAELVQAKVDVIVTGILPVTRAAKERTRTIPIVMAAGSTDPVADGLVASLARPDGNLTGLASGIGAGIFGKVVGLLKEAVPKVSRLVVLSSEAPLVEELQIAAETSRVTLFPLAVNGQEQLAPAFATFTRQRADGLLLRITGFTYTHRSLIADLATRHRLPSISASPVWAEAGGLMGYGTSLPDLFRRAAVYVDKILKGAKPADLPIEQPTKLDLIINLKTAKALGLTIPPAVLARADEVIQ